MGDLVEIPGLNIPNVYKVTGSAICFEVKAQELATLKLATKPDTWEYSINLKTDNPIAYISKSNEVLKSISSAHRQSLSEFRKYWVTWHDMVIRFGRDGEAEPFLSCQYDGETFQHVMFVTEDRRAVYWKFHVSLNSSIPKPRGTGEELRWVPVQGHIPDDALVGGYDYYGPLYVIRAHYEGSITPGKYSAVTGKIAYIGRDWKSHRREEFEILCGFNYIWVPARSGNIPIGAIAGGVSENSRREPLYVGRAHHNGQLIPGKIHNVTFRTCFVAYESKEISKPTYEVLVDPNVPNAGTFDNLTNFATTYIDRAFINRRNVFF